MKLGLSCYSQFGLSRKIKAVIMNEFKIRSVCLIRFFLFSRGGGHSATFDAVVAHHLSK